MDSTTTNFDEIFALVGTFGLYQKCIVLLLTVPATLVSVCNFSDIIFLLYTPEFECKYANEAILQRNASASKDKCLATNGSTVSPCLEWSYDKTYFDETLVTKWNLVCNRMIVRQTIIGLLYFSRIFSIVITVISDEFGRKVAFLANMIVFHVGTLLSLLAYNPVYFAICKFFGCIPCFWFVCYCWSLEFVGVGNRTTVTVFMMVMYSLSTASLTILAYFCRTWLQMGVCTSLPFLILFVYLFLIPESPMWLVNKGRMDEASVVLRSMARWNKVRLDETALTTMLRNGFPRSENSNAKRALLELFHSRNLRRRFFAFAYVAAMGDQIYNIIPYTVETLNTNFYFTFAVQALAEIPGVLTFHFLSRKCGRVLPLSAVLFLAALFNLVVSAPKTSPALVVVLLVASARYFASVCTSFNAVLVNELYPTDGRNIAAGFYMIASALVACVGQQTFLASTVWAPLPGLIVSAATFTGSLGALFLFDTSDKPLPNTVDEAERQGTVGFKTFRENVDVIKKAIFH